MARRHDPETSVTAETLRTILKYDPETGVFTRLTSTKAYGGKREIGSVAGLLCPNGRWYIGIEGRRYAAHRLAWLYMTGDWPSEVDHRDADPLNNRWLNLREATRAQNNSNVKLKSHNTSGIKGVCWDKKRGLWLAQIAVNKRHMHLGRFASKDDATDAYRRAAFKHHGEFARLA